LEECCSSSQLIKKANRPSLPHQSHRPFTTSLIKRFFNAKNPFRNPTAPPFHCNKLSNLIVSQIFTNKSPEISSIAFWKCILHHTEKPVAYKTSCIDSKFIFFNCNKVQFVVAVKQILFTIIKNMSTLYSPQHPYSIRILLLT